MRKTIFLLLSFILYISIFFSRVESIKAEENLDLNGNNVILIEASSGSILYSKNENEKCYPASMTKMMGMYLILEKIHLGTITWEDEVTCSEFASSMGGTQIFLEPGEKMPLKDLFKAVAVNSANDAIVCLGEYISGSNESFVANMNKKAKEMEMKNTNFVNATGFDDPEHYTTPFDMAILGRRLVVDYPEILEYSSLQEAYVRENSSNPFWLVNTNKLLKYVDGMDGLKTGFTNKAGYNLTSTVYKNGIRIIAVTMHEETIQKRSQDTIRLVNYAFSVLKKQRLYEQNSIVGEYEFPNSMNGKMDLIVKQNIDIITKENINFEDIKKEIIIEYNEKNEDQKVGFLKLTLPDNNVLKYDIFASEKIIRRTFWLNLLEEIKLIFF